MRPVFALATSIFVAHSLLLLVNCIVELHCAFDIVCTIETLTFLPTMGRMPIHRVHARLVNFETGMMDNIPGAMFGFLPVMLITIWALARDQHWLALRFSLVIALTIFALIINHAIVYCRIRDLVDDSTIAFVVEGATPLLMVGLVALATAVSLWRHSLPSRSSDWLSPSWKITLAKALIGPASVLELAVVLVLCASPSALSELFKSVTGYSVNYMNTIMGYSIPRCAATVVVGTVVAHALFLVSRRTHRQAIILLVPSAMLHVALCCAVTVAIVLERRHHRRDEAEVAQSDAAVEIAYTVLALLCVLTVCVIASLLLLRSASRAAMPAASDQNAVELRAWETHADLSDDAIDTASSSNSNSSSSVFEPVPSHVRLLDSDAKPIVHGQRGGEPVPSRSKISAAGDKNR
jgi:hypothetical protein